MPGLANDLNISEPGYVTHNGSGVFHGRTFQAGTGITLTNADGISGNTTIASTASLTDLHTARFIVASSTAGTGANFTSIASAIAAAQGTGINSTIFLQPGTYTENFSLPANINLCAYICDAYTPNVTISGKITCTDAGTRSISGITLSSNGAEFLSVTGNAATIVNLIDCNCNTAFDPGITYSSSSASSAITLRECTGNISVSAKRFFNQTSAGTLGFSSCNLNNTGASTTASTISAGSLTITKSGIQFPITTSGTGAIFFEHSDFNTSAQNATTLTCGGSGSSSALWCNFVSGSASAVSIGATLTMIDCNVNSTNTNAVTGAGTLIYSPIDFQGSSSTVNTSTQTPLQIGPRIYTNGGISFDSGTNLLANYATGTWTPTIVGGTVGGTTTYTGQNGYYTRIGNMVMIQGLVTASAATGTGNVTLGGFPFTIKNQTNGTSFGPFLSSSGAALTWPAGTTMLTAFGSINTITALIFASGTASAGGFLQMANTSLNFQFSMMYQI